MTEIPRGSSPEGGPTKEQKALAFSDELRLMQIDPVKARITSLDTGVVFTPKKDDDVYVVRIALLNPISGTDPVKLWEPRGFTKKDQEGGIITIDEGLLEDPETMYYSMAGGKITKDTRLRQYLSLATEKIIKPVDPKDTTGEWQKGEETTETSDALRRVRRLIEIPGEIHKTFGNYSAFEEALGQRKIPNIDSFVSTNGDQPWTLYYDPKYSWRFFAELVDSRDNP